MSFDNKTGFTFSGKDMDKEIEMTLEEMQLIQEHILRIRESKKQEINQNPTQDFCFHTHTQRKTNIKDMEDLVKESIQDVPDLNGLDDREKDLARQREVIIEQRNGQNKSRNIGD